MIMFEVLKTSLTKLRRFIQFFHEILYFWCCMSDVDGVGLFLWVSIFVILIQLYYFQCETKEEYNCAFPKVAHVVRHHTRLQGSKRSAAEPHLPQTSVQTCKLQFGLQTFSLNQESFLEGPVKKLPAFYGTSRAFITVVIRILNGQCAGFDGCSACFLTLSFDIILHCFVYLIEIFQPFFQWDMLVLHHAVWFTLDSQQLSSYIVWPYDLFRYSRLSVFAINWNR